MAMTNLFFFFLWFLWINPSNHAKETPKLTTSQFFSHVYYQKWDYRSSWRLIYRLAISFWRNIRHPIPSTLHGMLCLISWNLSSKTCTYVRSEVIEYEPRNMKSGVCLHLSTWRTKISVTSLIFLQAAEFSG